MPIIIIIRMRFWITLLLIGAGIFILFFLGAPTPKPGITGTSKAQPLIIQGYAIAVSSQHALNEEGKRLLQIGDCEAAIERFRAAFARDPDSALAYETLNNEAFCLYELGRQQDALIAWKQALTRNPNSADANAGYGMALYTSGQYAEGLAYYQQAVQLKASYAEETWLREAALWSEKAITDSQALRSMLP